MTIKPRESNRDSNTGSSRGLIPIYIQIKYKSRKQGSNPEPNGIAQEVNDVSGAGNTVIAVFSLAFASKANLRDAVVLSNLAAGIVVGNRGTARVLQRDLEEAVNSL